MFFRIKPAAGLMAIVAVGTLAGASFFLHSNPSLLLGAIKQEPATVKLFEKTGTIKSEKIVESSGLAFSQRTENILYTHNDSGHGVEVFAVSLSGVTIGQFELKGGKNLDWEAMTSFVIEGQPYLMVADVGDNLVKRDFYQLYIFPEPEIEETAGLEPGIGGVVKPISIRSKKLEFEYEDGPKNCEAIGVDPVSKEIWMVEKVYFDSKQAKPPGIYVLAIPLPEGKPGTEPHADNRKKPKRLTPNERTAKRIADFNVRNVTGMAFSRDGKRMIIRNYLNAHLYERSEEDSWRKTVTTSRPTPIPLPLQRQGEAICFTPDSRSLIVTSEMRRQAIWKVDLDGYLASRNPEAPKQLPSAKNGDEDE